MGMKIGSNYSSSAATGVKKPNSAMIATFRIPKKKNTKKKRLSYNFKKISNQILMSKTPSNAGKALNKARGTVIMLTMQQRSSQYDEKELKDALEHAEEMVRIAKKRKRHMEEEERAAHGGSGVFSEEFEEKINMDGSDDETDDELSSEELEELARELKELMQESVEESLQELADELTSVVNSDMSEEELEELKRRHRASELKEIMEADMKYLKALFDRLQKEKQQNSSSGAGVSLQISGMEIPVQETSPAPAEVVEGANVDVCV